MTYKDVVNRGDNVQWQKNKERREEPEMVSENGILYNLDDDGMYYPEFSKAPLYNMAGMGKFGRRYVRLLYDEDRFAYRKYMLDGTLEERARRFNEESYQLQEHLVEKSMAKFVPDKKDSKAVFQARMRAVYIADEMITADCITKIQNNKEQRLNDMGDAG